MKHLLKAGMLAGASLLWGISVYAQAGITERKCGMDALREKLREVIPDADAQLAKTLAENVAYAETYKSSQKTTLSSTIPVVFHIILTEAQINRLGGAANIARRVESQIEVLNADYNGVNTDASKIPAGFQPLYGNANIRFALAHRKEDGASTPGYEIISTTKTGFEQSSSVGSGMGFAEAKFLNGNVTAWNPDKYLNIWVINPVENGFASSILGLCVPPSFLRYGIPGMSKNELGVVLNYGAFGARATLNEYYISNITGGRTLTHEIGHYFELRHIWGDDDGKCAGSGGQDDGIADTPPQGAATYGCPAYPYYDACTATGNGIMFMNYMDYVNDNCMQMFTKGQVSLMQSQLTVGRLSFPLTQNPELTTYPLAVNDVSSQTSFSIYPNPATSAVNISSSGAISSVRMYDIAGRTVKQVDLARANKQEYTLDVSDMQKGIYLLNIATESGTEIQKLMIQ